jgi:hypothetical protein
LAVVVAGVDAKQRRHFRTAMTGLDLSKEIRSAVTAVLDSGTSLTKGNLPPNAEMFRSGILDTARRRGRLHVQIEVELAKRYTLKTVAMADRCLFLARLAIEHRASEQVTRFLSRVARCYVLGLYPESIVMCRAVLERSLAAKFLRAKKALPAVAAGKSQARANLARAEDWGWLTRKDVTEAWEVHQRGSKAVHEDPNLTADVAGTIQTAMRLVALLYDEQGAA